MKLRLGPLLPACAVLIAAGCASTSELGTAAPQQPSLDIQEKIVVGQTASRGLDEYVACLQSQACSKTTDKYVATGKTVNSEPKSPVSLNSHRVFFAWAKSAVSPGERSKLTAFARKAIRDESDLVIRGGTDPTGSKDFNFRLAQRRADSVKRELIKLGIPPSRITSERHDPCCEQPRGAGPMSNQDLRRADIQIEIHTGTKK